MCHFHSAHLLLDQLLWQDPRGALALSPRVCAASAPTKLVSAFFWYSAFIPQICPYWWQQNERQILAELSRPLRGSSSMCPVPSHPGWFGCHPTRDEVPAPLTGGSPKEIKHSLLCPHQHKQEQNLFLSAAPHMAEASSGIFHCPAPRLSLSCHQARLVSASCCDSQEPLERREVLRCLTLEVSLCPGELWNGCTGLEMATRSCFWLLSGVE